MRFVFPSLLATIAFWAGIVVQAGEILAPKLQRPVDAIWLAPGQVLVTANSRSGTLSVVDLATREVVYEAVLGGQPVSMLSLLGNRLAVIDQAGNRLWLLRVNRSPWSVVVEADLSVLRGPNSVVLLPPEVPGSVETAAPSGVQSVSIASRWDRSVERIELSLSVESSIEVGRRRLQLPFAPHEQLVLPVARSCWSLTITGGNWQWSTSTAGRWTRFVR